MLMSFIFGRIRAQDTNVGQHFADPDAATRIDAKADRLDGDAKAKVKVY